MTSLINAVILLFAIYTLASIAGLFSERSGVLNIALNGIMIFSNLMYAVVQTYLHNHNIKENIGVDIGAGLVAIATGIVVSMLFGVAVITLRADQVIAGTAINIMAPALSLLVIFFVSTDVYKAGAVTLQAAESYSTQVVKGGIQITWLIALVVALALSAFAYFFIKKIKLGKWIVAAGENPFALAAAGISPMKMRYLAVGISGALAGMGGILFGLINPAYGDVNGIGYLALGVLVLGQWRIIWVVIAAFVFSFSVSAIHQFAPLNMKYITQITPYLIPLIALPFFARFSRKPKFSGIPYVQSGR